MEDCLLSCKKLVTFGGCFFVFNQFKFSDNMMNKIGLTFLLVWFVVMAVAADYTYERNVPTGKIRVMNMLLKCAVWILLTGRVCKTRLSWSGFMAAA